MTSPTSLVQRRRTDGIPIWAKLLAAGVVGCFGAMTWALAYLNSSYITTAQFKAHMDVQQAQLEALERRVQLIETTHDGARLAAIESRLAGIEANLDWMKQRWSTPGSKSR